MMKTGRRADIGISGKGAAAMRVPNRLTRTLSMAFLVVVSLSSCQEFFTTSFATALARDSYPIPADMSVADASALLDQAMLNGDANMAAALVTPLYAAASAATPGTAAYDEAASALASAVILSSGVAPAATSIGLAFASIDLSSPTPAQIAEALAPIETVSLTDDETAALIMIAANPPAGLSADDAYVAALALASDAFTDAGVSISSLASFDELLDVGSLPIGVDANAINAALALLTYAQGLGTSSLLGDILNDLQFTP
jgi:hypothetical protein